MPRVYDSKAHKNLDLPTITPSSTVPTTGLTQPKLVASTVTVTGTVAEKSQPDTIELLMAILTELRVISNILNEGLNTKEDIDTLRVDEESNQE